MNTVRTTSNRYPLIISAILLMIAIFSLIISFSAQAMSFKSMFQSFADEEQNQKPSVRGASTKAPVSRVSNDGKANQTEAAQIKGVPPTAQPAVAQKAPVQQPVEPVEASVFTEAPASSFVEQTDTAPGVRALAAAQTQQVASSVEYPSKQISATKRDQLYTIALSIVLIGASLYSMTLLRTVPYSMVEMQQRRPLYIK